MSSASTSNPPRFAQKGAVAALTFNDAGAASTHAGMTVPVAKGLFNHLQRTVRPDVIVAELGDGILGTKFDFDIGVVQGAGAFVCGESTALMAGFERARGEIILTLPAYYQIEPAEIGKLLDDMNAAIAQADKFINTLP